MTTEPQRLQTEKIWLLGEWLWRSTWAFERGKLVPQAMASRGRVNWDKLDLMDPLHHLLYVASASHTLFNTFFFVHGKIVDHLVQLNWCQCSARRLLLSILSVNSQPVAKHVCIRRKTWCHSLDWCPNLKALKCWPKSAKNLFFQKEKAEGFLASLFSPKHQIMYFDDKGWYEIWWA